MSEPAAKIRIWWLIIAAVPAFLLGALLFRGCKGIAAPCPAVNVDSLQMAWAATFPKDTIILPGKQDTIRKTRVVNLKDTAEVNQLRRELEENAKYTAGQLAALQKALGEYQEKERQENELAAWNMLFKAQTGRDSVVTSTYRYWWETEAEGKILSHRFGITPIIPDCPGCEPLPVIRKHRAGVFLGGQFQGSELRPIYGAQYQYRFATFGVGYIPGSGITKSAFQVQVGATVGLK